MRPERQGRPANVIQSAPQTSESINNKKSTDLLGNEIKTDAEGRYDLDQVKDRNVLEQFAMGLPVTTEQMIQMPKDAIEGVRSENQAMKESGLDLLLTPLIAPFAGQKELGITNKDWYWPEEINQAVGALPIQQESLPPFLRRGGGSTMGVLEGFSHNASLFGEVAMHPATGAFRDEEFAKSGERFATAPAYYIGTAVGEIPYWFVGVGEAKLIASVGSKSAAIAVTSAAKTGNIPKITKIAQMIKAEKAHFALEKALVKERKIAGGLLQTAYADGQGAKSSIRALATISPKVKNAINILKKDDANMVKIQIDEQASHIKSLERKQNEMNNKISTETDGAAKKILRAERDKLTDEIKSANDRISDIKSSAKTSKTASLERQLDELLKSATDSPTAENRLRYLKLVEDEVSPLMKKKYDDVKLTSDNIMRMRREALITKKFKLNQKIKEAEKSTDPKIQKKITSYQEELKDIQYKLDFHENIRIDELIKSIRAAPETIPRRITKRFEKRATTPGDDNIESFFKNTFESRAERGMYDGPTGSLRFIKDWYEGGINKAKNREVQYWSDTLSAQVPKLNILSSSQMKQVRKNLFEKRAELQTDLGELLSGHGVSIETTLLKQQKAKGDKKRKSIIPNLDKKNEKLAPIIDEVESIENQIKQIDYVLDNDSKFSFKVPGSERAYMEFELIRYLEPEIYESIKPKEILFTTRPAVKAVKSHGVITAEIEGTGWEAMIYPKKQPPKSRLKRKLKPSNPFKRLTEDNAEIMFYSRREIAGPVDPDPVYGSKSKIAQVVRVPKRLDDSAKDMLRRQGYMRPLKESDVPLPMEGLPGDMELWEMVPITKYQRKSDIKIFTGRRDSANPAEEQSLFSIDYIDSFRDMLMNKQDEFWYSKRDSDLTRVIESGEKRIDELSQYKVLSKEGKQELLTTREIVRDVQVKRAQYRKDVEGLEESRKMMAELNISPYGIPRGTIFHFKDAKTLTRNRQVNESNVIVDTMTNKRYVVVSGTKNPTGMFEVLDEKFFDLYREEPNAFGISEYRKNVKVDDEKGAWYTETKQFIDDTKMERGEMSKIKSEFMDKNTIDLNKVTDGEERWSDVVRAVTPEELDEMNRMTNLGKIQTGIQKKLDRIDQSETTVKSGSGEGGSDVSTKSKKKILADTMKIITMVKGKNTVKNIRSLFESERFRMEPRVRMTPHSDFVDQMMNEGVVIGLPENNPIAQIFTSSNDLFRQGKESSSLVMNVQPTEQMLRENPGIKVYGIYDTQIVSGTMPNDPLSRSISTTLDDHDKFNKFKASKGNSDVETLRNIINNANDVERKTIQRQIIRNYLKNVKRKDTADQSKFEGEVSSFLNNKKSMDEMWVDIEQNNLFRTPTKKEKKEHNIRKKSNVIKRTESIERDIGLINPNKTLNEMSFMFSSGDVKSIPHKIRSYLLGKLVINDALFTDSNKNALLTSGLSKMVYGVNKKRMVSIMQNPGVRKGYLEAIEFKRDHGLKVSRGEARIYNTFKGRNLTDMEGALVRQGVNTSGLRNELDVGGELYRKDGDRYVITPNKDADEIIKEIRWAQKEMIEVMKSDPDAPKSIKLRDAEMIQPVTPTIGRKTRWDQQKRIDDPSGNMRQFTLDEWDTFDPFRGSLETMDYDLAAIKTKELMLREWGISKDAYKTTDEMLREIEIRNYLGNQLKDAQNVLADKKSTTAQKKKAETTLVSAAKGMDASRARMEGISQAMKSQKTSTMQKQVTPGKPANPASLPERIISFSMSDFVPQTQDSGWTTGHFMTLAGTQIGTITPTAYAEEQDVVAKPEQGTINITQTPIQTPTQSRNQKDASVTEQSVFQGLKDIQNMGERTSVTGLGALVSLGTVATTVTKPAEAFGQRLLPIQDTILDTTQNTDRLIRSQSIDFPTRLTPSEQRLFPADQVFPRVSYMPRRIFPPIIGFPPIGYERAQERRRQRRGKSKKKKQWWQTPEWWYQPYYWGGKDQMGAGYTTFTGREPSKVKRYEKQFFGGF